MNFKYISLAIFYLQTHRFVIQIKKRLKDNHHYQKLTYLKIKIVQ